MDDEKYDKEYIDQSVNKLRFLMKDVGDFILIDKSEKKVGDVDIPYWNNTMMALSRIMDRNLLYVGEPGHGKTTAAKVTGTLFNHLPYDLFETVQIQGHPEQTKEEMLARLNFSKLSESEVVIWQMTSYLDTIIVDEINRLPPGKQDILLNFMQTGRISYLNDTLYTGPKFFVATANHPDDGNHIMIPAMVDRFHAHIEMGYQGKEAEKDIEKYAQKYIKSILSDKDMTERVIESLQDSSKNSKEKLDGLTVFKTEFLKKMNRSEEKGGLNGLVLDEDEIKAVKTGIQAMKIEREARIFYDTIISEANYSPTNGLKRSCDEVDTSIHSKNISSSFTENALSYRAGAEGLKTFAKAVAFYMGDDTVEKHHITAVAPYILGHKLVFTDDFMAEYRESPKNTGCEVFFHAPTFQQYLVQKLMEGVEKNFSDTVMKYIPLMTAYEFEKDRLTDEQKKKAQELIDNKDKLDHPLLKEFVNEIQREKRIDKFYDRFS